MNNKKVALAIVMALTLFGVPVKSLGQKEQEEILIPAKTTLSLELLSPLSTATSQKGDKFSCKVLSPAELVGSVISGYVLCFSHLHRPCPKSLAAGGSERVEYEHDYSRRQAA